MKNLSVNLKKNIAYQLSEIGVFIGESPEIIGELERKYGRPMKNEKTT